MLVHARRRYDAAQVRVRLGDGGPAKENIKADISAAPEKRKAGPTIELLRVRADEMSDVQANWLDDAPVDLIVGQDLSGAFDVGGSGVVPAYVAQAGETTSFTARFMPAR